MGLFLSFFSFSFLIFLTHFSVFSPYFLTFFLSYFTNHCGLVNPGDKLVTWNIFYGMLKCVNCTISLVMITIN